MTIRPTVAALAESLPKPLLSDDELDRVILAAVSYGGGATMEDIERVVEWAENVRVDAALLRLALDGKLALAVSDEPGDIKFRLLDGGVTMVTAPSEEATR